MNKAGNNLSRIAMVLTAHPQQQKWWAPVLLSLERYSGPLILSYDDRDCSAIPPEILSRFSTVAATGYPAGHLGLSTGELVCLREGFDAATELGMQYVLKLGFDEPVWRWRNVAKLVERLETEGLDIIDCETRIIFGRPLALWRVMTVIDVEKRIGGSAEGYWTTSVGQRKLKRLRIDDRLYWEHLLGVIHVQGEYAANCGQPNRWSWTIGEIWPRDEEARR